LKKEPSQNDFRSHFETVIQKNRKRRVRPTQWLHAAFYKIGRSSCPNCGKAASESIPVAEFAGANKKTGL